MFFLALFDILAENRIFEPRTVFKQVSFKKEIGVMVNDLAFWLTVCLILKMCYKLLIDMCLCNKSVPC